jgi:hypothetical protein
MSLASMCFSRNIDPFAAFAFRRHGTHVFERGKVAHWIGAPTHRSDDQPLDLDHARFA